MWGVTPTERRFTDQREEAALGSLYDYGARMYSHSLRRFISADTIVPSPGDPQSLNRYGYGLNNPLKYTDPTGHWPAWWNRAVGGIAQYFNDTSLGLFGKITELATNMSLDEVADADFQQGREYGRAVAVLQGAVEEAVGAAAVGAGLAAGPPTVALTGAAAVPTGGTVLIPGAVALTAEGVMVVVGAVGVAHGAGSLAYIKNDPITKRPSGFRKQTVQDAWDNAADGPTEGKLCPTCGKEVKVPPGEGHRDWDIDHQPPWSQRDLTGKTRREILDEYNRGTRLECPHCNRQRGARPE